MNDHVSSEVTQERPLFPFTRDSQFDLPREYAEAQSKCPVAPVKLWNGQDAWLLTKYADLCSVLVDPRFSGQFSRTDFPSVTRARQQIDRLERSFVGMDNPDHDRFRRMVTKEFTTKRMLALREPIEAITAQLFDQMEAKGSPCDFVQDFAIELPAIVMCELFGSPYEDHTFIAKCAAGRHGLKQSPEEARKSAGELVQYCRDLIARKEAQPGDDMISRIIAAHIATGELDREEFADMCAMILRAGHDTTVNMIALGTLLLLRHPEQLQRLKDEPEIVDSAVEEMLRFLSPVQFAPRRVALEDVEVNGAAIRKGDGIFALCPVANRDPDEFPAPEKFDLGRDASAHVTFGYGIHRCLGQQLARIELQVVFSQLFKRFPNLRLAEPFEEVPFKYDSQIYGVYRLMLEW